MAEGGAGSPGRYPGKASKATCRKCSVSETAVWYKIPVIQVGELTTRLNPEVSQLLETSYQRGKTVVSFKDNDTGSNFTAYLEKKELCLQGNYALHAHLARVCEERQSDITINTAVDQGQSPQTSNEKKTNDTRQRQMVEQYKEKASKLVAWLKDVTNRIMLKEFPANLKDMKEQLAEIDRIGTDEMPIWNEEKKVIFEMYEDLQNDDAKSVNIDESLDPAQIKELIIKFNSEIKNRRVELLAEIARLEGLQEVLEKIQKEAYHLEGRLDDLECHIGGGERKLNAVKSTEGKQQSVLDGELKDIDGRITGLIKAVQALPKGKYSHTHEVLNRVLCIMKRACHLRTTIDNSDGQKLPPETSANKVMTLQYQQSCVGAQTAEAISAPQHVKFCLQWIQNKHALLEGAEFGNSIDSVKQALDLHQKEHEEIINFKTEMDKLVTDRENLSKKEQDHYNEWLSKVQDAYLALLDSSLQQLQWLKPLLYFVQSAEQELAWCKEKIEQICNCSIDLLNMPLEQIYQDVKNGMTNQEASFILVQEYGHFLVSQSHPAKKTIETFVLSMKFHWSWVQLFLDCLDIQIINRFNVKKFFEEAERFESWMRENIETIYNWMRLHNSPVEELQKMKKYCQDLQNEFAQYEVYVTSLCQRSCSLIPFNQRFRHGTFLNKVCCICIYEQPTISLHAQEECTLLDNSQKVKWKVRNARGQEDLVPSICLQILPPNTEAVVLADRLQRQLAELKPLLRNLTQNVIVSQMQFFKTLDKKQFQSQDLADCVASLRDLNNDTTKLIKDLGDTDQKMVEQLQKELDECKQKLADLTKEIKEQEQGSKNDPAVQRTQHSTEEAVSSVLEPNRSRRENETDSELPETDKELLVNETVRESLEHVKERENEIEKSVTLILTIPVVQMLIDSNFQGELTRHIPTVAVVPRSNEVIFHGPPEAIRKAEEHLEEYLKSNGYLHELASAASVTALCKRLNFEYYIKMKFPDVRIIFIDMKIIFIGEGKLIKEVEDELCRFQSATKWNVLPFCSSIQNYLKLQDVQKYIWKHLEERHIECFWQVTKEGIELFCRNEDQSSTAKSALDECIACRKLSFKSDSDFQRFQDNHDVKNIIHQNEGRLYQEVLEVGCFIYVGMPEVIAELEKLYDRHMIDQKNQPQGHSSQVLLSHSLLAFAKKYLMENIREEFKVILELDDLSGIKIIGSKDTVQNAVLKVEKHVQEMFVDVCLLHSPKVADPITRIVKDIVTTVGEENKTIVEIISLPGTGKKIMTVTVNNTLDICLVYGSSPSKDANVELIPLNDCFIPVCLAALDIMEKGVDLPKKAAAALHKYIQLKAKKPEAFTFIADKDGDSKHLLYFVVPDIPNNIVNFEKDFKKGLMAVFDYASERSMTLSLPVEMHEKLPVRTMSTIIMEAVNAYLAEVAQQTSIKKIFLCSVEKSSHMILKQVLDAVTQTNSSGGKIEEDYCDIGGLNDPTDWKKLPTRCKEAKMTYIRITGSDFASVKTTDGKLKERLHQLIAMEESKSVSRSHSHGSDRQHKQSMLSFVMPAQMAISKTLQYGQVQVHAKLGTFENESQDCLLVFWDKQFLYNISKNKILHSAGSTVTQKWAEHRNQQLFKKGVILVTLGGNLKYTNIIHVACDINTINKATVAGLMKADLESMKTVVVPILPDDSFNRDVNKFCTGILRAIKELATKLKFVRLVTLVIQGKHNFPFFSEVFEQESREHRRGKKTDNATEEVVTPTPPPRGKKGKSPEAENIGPHEGVDDGLKVPMTWEKVPTPSTETARTYLEMIGDASNTSVKTSDTIQERSQQFKSMAGKETTARCSDSQSSNILTGSFDPVKVNNEDRESKIPQKCQDESPNSWKNKMERASALTTEKLEVPFSCPAKTDLSDVDQEDIMAYMECKMEVKEDVLNSIKITYGQKGIDSLISDLDQFAKVEMHEGRILVLSDYKYVENVQRCVRNHYIKVKNERKTTEENKHLINGGNDNLMEWLQFAYSHTSWSKNLQLEGGKLYLTGTLQMKREVEKAVHSMNYWYKEEFALTSEEQQKADEIVALVKNELLAIFIKQTNETIAVLSDNIDNFERAKYKVKAALGRIKITARGRGHRDPQHCGESFSGLSKDDKMNESPKFPSSGFQMNQPTADLTPKSYFSKEGLTAKVYHGNITSLSVDCIVNAANGLLLHSGGVALAISKAAGGGFDQESKAFIRKNGLVPVTCCCVTSAGRLPYKMVIHAVGPHWSDYKYNEKDKCINDLKKTIVSCLIEANKFKMVSIAIPPLSSGIFGVPKDLCAQMYAKGVVEYSKTYGLQYVKEIHFVDTVSEMCQLTQSAFDKELQCS